MKNNSYLVFKSLNTYSKQDKDNTDLSESKQGMKIVCLNQDFQVNIGLTYNKIGPI